MEKLEPLYIYIYTNSCKHEQKMLVPMRGHSPHDHRWDEAVWVKGEIPPGPHGKA
jgi:hypothetical protein